MKELYKILLDNISHDKGFSVTIDVGNSKATIRIHQSAAMVLLGIGKQNTPGFALYVSIDNKSNKGKEIIDELAICSLLKKFKTVNDKRSKIYVFDFKMDIDQLLVKLRKW